jgi:carbonic anhydrase/acetyltransferase-like protein (isoleucine patch superfamily)
MALIKTVNNHTPKLPETCFLAENATIVGHVEAGENCSFWFSSVVRGDVCKISLGNKVNVQDGAVLHGTYKKHDLIIGNNVSIGHNANVHGCTVEDNVLIGMGATVMDGCLIKSNSIVAAGSVVTQNTVVESGCIYAGVPAKKVKEVAPEQFEELVKGIADNYVMYSSWFEEEK